MVKIAVLVRYSGMTKIAERSAKEQDIDIACIKTIETVDTVNEARMAVESGAHIIVARGYQAKLIKPDPEIYRLLCDRYGLNAKECVFIDDTEKNVLAAQKEGMEGIIFHTLEQAKEELDEMLSV